MALDDSNCQKNFQTFLNGQKVKNIERLLRVPKNSKDLILWFLMDRKVPKGRWIIQSQFKLIEKCQKVVRKVWKWGPKTHLRVLLNKCPN